ncbi:VIN3-like protein 2 [Linum grandiflorum]
MDFSNYWKLNMKDKTKLVYELSDQPDAAELLQAWSRQDILQILCSEMGKERKYTGLTKLKIIEQLLRIVHDKRSSADAVSGEPESSASPVSKRQRKMDDFPPRTPSLPPTPTFPSSNTVYCKNSACKATMKQDDPFCKRCSCCICCKYDDNKDPSLWMTCSEDPPFQGPACGMSCHLDCALKHETTGIGEDDGGRRKLDCSFRCVGCGKVNDLLVFLRKQLMIAKETRRVDILCYRLSVSRTLLNGTVKYQQLLEMVAEAIKELETEVGPITGLPVKMGRGIVNRLSVGPAIQKQCASVLESLENILSTLVCPPPPVESVAQVGGSNLMSRITVRFEDVSAIAITLVLRSEDSSADAISGYNIWHRKATDTDYSAEPTCRLCAPNTKYIVTGLQPATEYSFKVSSFNNKGELGRREVHYSTCEGAQFFPAGERSESPVTNCSSFSNPSSVEDETNHSLPTAEQIVNRADNYLTYGKDGEKLMSVNMASVGATCPGIGNGKSRSDAVALLDEEHGVQGQSCVPNSDVGKLETSHPSNDCQIVEKTSTDKGSDVPPVLTGVGNLDASLPITPCKEEIVKDVQGRNARSKPSYKDASDAADRGREPQDGSTSKSKKRSADRLDEQCTANGNPEEEFEYCVKMIRWLECQGLIEKNFRQKFLTWYSLRANTEEMRVVKAYVDTFVEDPSALAEQLVDTFSECISSSRRSSAVPAGFCTKLWH